MKQFVGDLSREDAEIIELYASGSSGVLEFGAGGSTHIIAQSTASGVPFVSLETDQAWIQMTEERLEKIGVREKCKFVLYDDDWRANIVTACGEYSMVFVDGADSLRRQVSVETWPLLNVGGFMLFHDTRRIGDFENMVSVMQTYQNEIESVFCNQRFSGISSNVSVIKKKQLEPYVDWNLVCEKPDWMRGGAQVPDEFWKR